MRSNTRFKSTLQALPAGDAEAFEEFESSRRRSNGVDANRCENPKIGLEPQQMKRKKKGGESNFRKSLAWDRAFFTEEGILDPLELSIITGASQRREQSFIHEDSSASTMLLVQGNQMKDAKDGGVEKSRTKECPSPLLHSSPHSIITSPPRSSHGIATRSAGKSVLTMNYYSQPPQASSLKRPANLSTGKGQSKLPNLSTGIGQSKLPKVPIPMNPRLNSAVASRRSSVPRANHVTHNQLIKSVGSNSQVSSLGSDCCPNNQFASCKIFGWKDENPSSKTISEDMPPATSINAMEGKDEPATAVVPLKAQESSKIHSFPGRTLKPTGLRMPSPSLSFFSQPKKCSFSPKETETTVYGHKEPHILMLREMNKLCSEKKGSNCLVSNHRPYVGVDSEHDVDARVQSTSTISSDWKHCYRSVSRVTHAKGNYSYKVPHAEMGVFVTKDVVCDRIDTSQDDTSTFGESADLEYPDIASSNKDSDFIQGSHCLQRNVSSSRPAGEVGNHNSVFPSENLTGHDTTGLVAWAMHDNEFSGGESVVEDICPEVRKDHESAADEACKYYQNYTELSGEESGVEDICSEALKDHENSADKACKDYQNATEFCGGESGVSKSCRDAQKNYEISVHDVCEDYKSDNKFCGGESGVKDSCPDVQKDYRKATDEACNYGELVKLEDSFPKTLSNSGQSATCNDVIVSSEETFPDSISVEVTSAANHNKSEECTTKVNAFVVPGSAVPFSEEWLAAIEAAGEDILTRKGGAVKNSPPDKTVAEPSPWSPVKRKTNYIGPFDCTKFTNVLPGDSI